MNSYNISFQSIVDNDILTRVDRRSSGAVGLAIALTIIALWSIILPVLLSLNLREVWIGFIQIAILWQMFLDTGLFITAHDAMHGAVYRKNPKINHSIGALTCFLYCFFPYKELFKKHALHHNHPASELDPDYHDGRHSNPIAWYLYFMKSYWSWYQFIGMTVLYYISIRLFHVEPLNFWLLLAFPLILSSLQLFYFGTYLPHREPIEGYKTDNRARTIELPVFWSFLACYHFGYHNEHHQYPRVPWWQLPTVYRQNRQLKSIS
ncbi:fatty acid desaturase [Pannus brasiliensis CCIBt3594]|uniref:Fatty acid desaturase n=1 Tax=Pannus brasiliensis CCIBt3594 TaxID=1427578 RepID=A0AAW9QLB8_9CHRO